MKINPKLYKILAIAKNKWVITILVFALLMVFEKNHNIVRLYHFKKQKKELQIEKENLKKQIAADSANMANIQKNISEAEKFGREKYLMKKDNEDIFIIRHAEDTSIKENFLNNKQ